jgi:VCBS repeat protein/fibronectin type III domain protein
MVTIPGRALRVCAALGLALYTVAAAPVEAASVTLAWDPNPEAVAGYIVFYGTASGLYTSQVDVGSHTQHTLLNITPGTYYFAVRAYDADGLRSDTSDEVSTVVESPTMPATPAPDFDGDRASDPAVWRPSTGTWYWLSSAGGLTSVSARGLQWGNESLGDVPLSGDIDGDGTADLVLWRASTGTWFWLTSSTGYNYASGGSRQWGNLSLGDVPMLADIDGDSAADLIVWRASTGTWHWLTSSTEYGYAAAGARQWGNDAAGDLPLLGDFDADGQADLAVWRRTDGTWYWLTSSTGYSYARAANRQWGNSGLGDQPLVGDVDGDRKTDLTLWRASTGTWFSLTSSSGYAYSSAVGVQWGNQLLGDVAALADFEGDGKADLCVWRASTGTWHWLKSSAGFSYASAGARQWGSFGDIPIAK